MYTCSIISSFVFYVIRSTCEPGFSRKYRALPVTHCRTGHSHLTQYMVLVIRTRSWICLWRIPCIRISVMTEEHSTQCTCVSSSTYRSWCPFQKGPGTYYENQVLTVPLTNPRQIGHFLMAGAHSSQQHRCPQGNMAILASCSRHTLQSLWYLSLLFSSRGPAVSETD